MAVGFRLTSILLVCMLSELDHSSAFPRARSSVYPETWQGLSEKPQGGYNFGNRRPLQYVQALRQAHRKLQPNIHDQFEVKTWQKPQGSSLSHAQIQNHPGVYRQTQSRIHTSLPQPPALENHLLPKPRNFEFSLKVPFASSLGQNKETETKETSLGTKSSDSNSGGSDGAGQYSQSYRPSSVQIHSNFSSPSGLDAFLDKGSTNDRNGEKNAHEVTKPSFQLSLSVPIPTTTQSSKPSSSNDGYSENLKRPGTAGFVQNSYTEPSKPLFSSTQTGSGWTLLNSGKTVQQQTEQQIYDPVRKPITFSPGHASQHVAPTEQIGQEFQVDITVLVWSNLITMDSANLGSQMALNLPLLLNRITTASLNHLMDRM
ncbi:uncharacterized protein LOC121181918 [Toxotes jaculatrix]|uniref:uncharacterized protein LOC121181918 n=1 Tax=Toxotes jaculatrix TaxID=941984 RepID=UPI001B3AEDDA|nr:uncharacterized protein LOC121181918 [Toxotes jaculatrix]